MLGATAGKLKWEPNDQGIRVELRAPLDWPHIRWEIASSFLVVLVIYLIFSVEAGIRHGTYGAFTHEAITHRWFLATFAPLYVAAGIWNILVRRTILTLTPSEMTLNKGIRETSRNTRVFANGRLHNLRFCASRVERTAEYERVEDSILCDVEGRTIAIMSGIAEEEATTLIEKMMAIYKFSKCLESEVAVPEGAGD
jgi:hypothetical protein